MLSYMGESLQDEKGSKGTDTHTQNGLFSITNVQFLSLFFWGFQKTRKKKKWVWLDFENRSKIEYLYWNLIVLCCVCVVVWTGTRMLDAGPTTAASATRLPGNKKLLLLILDKLQKWVSFCSNSSA